MQLNKIANGRRSRSIPLGQMWGVLDLLGFTNRFVQRLVIGHLKYDGTYTGAEVRFEFIATGVSVFNCVVE